MSGTEASRARVRALCARATTAIGRAGTLHAAATTLRAAAGAARERATALRFDVAARRHGHWSGRWTALPTAPGAGAQSFRRAGTPDRIVRRRVRRRQAAATAGPPPDAPVGWWAGATVYAERTLLGPERTALSGLAPDAECWTVRELDARALPGARGPRCLVFENHEIVRRVWSYPATWESLPAASLFRLAGLAA